MNPESSGFQMHGFQYIQQQQQPNIFENCLGPGGARKKRPQPTQIPIQALQFNEFAHGASAAWRQPRKVSEEFPPLVEQQQQSGSPQTFAEVTGNSNCPPPPHYITPQQQHVFLMNQVQATPLPIKLIEAARQGYSQFQRDFSGDSVYMPPPPPRSFYQIEPPETLQRDFLPSTNIAFEVNDSAFQDTRPIVNYIEPGQREFKLFDDYKKSGADQIKNVYNVNTIDYCNAREICGKRLYHQSIERWPVDVIGTDLGELKKQALQLPGRQLKSQSTFLNILDVGLEFEGAGLIKSPSYASKAFQSEKPSNSRANAIATRPFPKTSNFSKPMRTQMTGAGEFGLISLARCLSGEGGERNKMGYVTFVGMNLHKLFKDIDRSEPVCPSFAGPLADRNYQLNHSRLGMTKGFPEYELDSRDSDGDVPNNFGKIDWRERYNEKIKIRIKRRLMDNFNFETVAFMFYTFHGDALQLLAAQQLYKRGWRFHKLFQVWMTPIKMSRNMMGNSQNRMDKEHEVNEVTAYQGDDEVFEEPRHHLYVKDERDGVPDREVENEWVPGVYTYFDYIKWEFLQVELKHVNECVLEGRPMDYEDPLWD